MNELDQQILKLIHLLSTVTTLWVPELNRCHQVKVMVDSSSEGKKKLLMWSQKAVTSKLKSKMHDLQHVFRKNKNLKIHDTLLSWQHDSTMALGPLVCTKREVSRPYWFNYWKLPLFTSGVLHLFIYLWNSNTVRNFNQWWWVDDCIFIFGWSVPCMYSHHFWCLWLHIHHWFGKYWSVFSI